MSKNRRRTCCWVWVMIALGTCGGALSFTPVSAQDDEAQATEAVPSPKIPSAPISNKASDEEESDRETSPDAIDATETPMRPQPVRVSLVRPLMTEEQRTEWAERLRQIYGQNPELWPPPLVDRSVKWKEIGLLPEVEHPEDNAHSLAKVKLGMQLFFDPRLSGSEQIACASCHDPDLAWADGRTTAIGNKRKMLKRNAPSLLNVGHGDKFFWDGRAASLEEQARGVLLNPDEMDSSDELIQKRLGSLEEYRVQFKECFGDESVNIDRVVEAVACFERTIVGGRSAFDHFLRGRKDALSDEAIIGLHLFRTEAHCMNCHHGPNFTDNLFHDLGLSYYGRQLQDLGRFEVTQENADVGRFKTPTLRNIANTRPYMHVGLFPLDGVMNLYNAGMPSLRRKEHQMEDPLFPTKSPLLSPLYFNRQDLNAVKTFLEALSEPPQRIRPPKLPGLE